MTISSGLLHCFRSNDACEHPGSQPKRTRDQSDRLLHLCHVYNVVPQSNRSRTDGSGKRLLGACESSGSVDRGSAVRVDLYSEPVAGRTMRATTGAGVKRRQPEAMSLVRADRDPPHSCGATSTPQFTRKSVVRRRRRSRRRPARESRGLGLPVNPA